jgi:hypothetical protein
MIDHSYRIYGLAEDGRIRGASSRQFVDDAEAIGHARSLLEIHPGVEIWQTDRLVRKLERDAEARSWQAAC